ncbi:7-cyano-7-deazaguanine synthase [Pseudohongiella nitratireducens]|uniref:7-cyano-7-deazaguanine synthase n=1 Tax=Pseudohongiella nitratireducens TaxID=1768907 RepID=A0A917GUB3_9GAMM|nr:7-cyano-7-deazaguanine synthase QueC [Pseudohongiella nitratireducens]MDF1623741.1 7-cyano-7-deazaguanine synthase QueC [Pseudohongiella nitratireducens]GGG57039.1 7-cyano-7-deazaguanine synthase [Pseudohongiella nitratireducens]
MKKAVILVSGGLDSATCLAIAREQGYTCYAISFDYGQRANSELDAARRLVAAMEVEQHLVIPLGMGQLGGSALTDTSLDVPEEEGSPDEIPVTYVPARNTVFLSYALGWAEVLDASAIFIGVNALDYSGYPDCRPDFIGAFERMANLATRAGVEGHAISIEAPLINMSKADIIRCGVDSGVDYGLTVSCYQADGEGRACGRCDSCRLRRKGFVDAGVEDPTRYFQAPH